jgi:hypothetical protein
MRHLTKKEKAIAPPRHEDTKKDKKKAFEVLGTLVVTLFVSKLTILNSLPPA